jgi:branched-chain amino acid transport system ATP-binding protein
MFQLMGSIALGFGLCVVWLAVVPIIALVLGGMTLLFLLAALVLPAYGTLFSIVMPAKARTVGFALTRLWALPGLVMLPIAGGIGDAHGLDVGILAGVPIFQIGALIVGLGGRSFQSDMAEAAESSMQAIEAQRERRKAARLATEAAEGDALLD